MTTFERIQKIAQSKGYSSLRKLAEDSSLGTNAIYQWKTKTPRTDNLQAVADTLGVTVDYLLGNTDDPNGASTEGPTYINLDEALRKQGVVMEFQGKELSDKAKRKILDILKIVDDDED
ncbi:helix-turn-helix domain-containing protein [Weissella cibaria]|uniref:helix-turn-helix domain-containing protein n=1 Tax=Weissella cibaria TaxID=137591 RepID=UPI0013DB4657|nr:helix-turn-helix transcriptional regulator [Weissella cibaria]NFA02025.1 XRE family transcriptional regulator [Weissella cibaria]